jgi:hypothetical protein
VGSLDDIGNAFLNRTPIVQKIRIRIGKWNCITLKSFYIAEETIPRTERKLVAVDVN